MRRQNIRSFPFQLALLLALCLALTAAVQAEEVNRTNSGASAGDTLTDADIKTMLRDCIDADQLAVGLVIGTGDEHGTRIVSHGKLDNGASAEVDGDTIFEIGSITKVFTGLLLQDMVDRGEMKLDDPVQKYLPKSVKMPIYQGKPITLLHLATHTSGLPREVNNFKPRSWRNPGEGYTVGQAYEFLSHCKLRCKPGTREEYSNLGIDLLGHVIALKAGKDYEALLLERICRPLGMDSTRIALPPELKSRLAVGHAMPGRRVPSTDFSVFQGAGAIQSTANDLLKFVSAYLGLTPSPLSRLMQNAEAYHSMEDGAKRRLIWGGGNVFEHGGLTYGFVTELAFDSKKRRAVVVLSNCANSSIVNAIWQRLLEGRSPKPDNAAAVKPVLYDRYVGQYQTGPRAARICTICRDGGRLRVRVLKRSGEPVASYEVFPESESVFSNPFWNERLSFAGAGDDQALKLTLVNPRGRFELSRISTNLPAPPAPVHVSPVVYDQYVGRYRKAFLFGLVHLGPSFNVRHETDECGEHLVGYVTGKHIEKYLPSLSGDLMGGEVFPVNETTFFSPFLDESIEFSFVRDKKGRTKGILIHTGGSSIRADRVSSQPTD